MTARTRRTPVALDPATVVQQRLEREERLRARRMRLISLAAALATVGVVLVAGTALSLHPQKAGAASAALAVIAARPTTAPLSEALPPAQAPGPAPAAEAKSRSAVTAAPRRAAATSRPKAADRPGQKVAPSPQRFSIGIGSTGYEPSRISASTSRPIVLTVAKGDGCAAGFEIPSLGVHMDNSAGSATKDLGIVGAGTYTYTCSMGMVTGTLVVR